MNYFCVECGKEIKNYNDKTTTSGYIDLKTGDIYFKLMCDDCFNELNQINERIEVGL